MNKMFFRMLAIVMIISTISCFSAPLVKNSSVDPKTPTITNKLIGTWQQCRPDSTLVTDISGQAGTTEYKILTGETFTVIMVENNKKFFMGEYSGSYTVKDDIYTENIQFSHPSMTSGVGASNTFKFELRNGYFIIKGTNNNYNQIWKKIKD
jgi:hypothetical protein